MDVRYVAGFFDADGHVGISKTTVRDCVSYTLHAMISNTHVGSLERIKSVYGGTIFAKSQLADNWLHQYYIVWYSISAKKFLSEIQQHLIIKKEQVDLALQFPLNEKREKNNIERVEIQKQIFETIKELKRIKRDIPPEYLGQAKREHAEMLRKKRLALKLHSEHPDWALRQIAEQIGVSREMVYKYLKTQNNTEQT